jgi:multicomponent Na+:H+ antiporter subunit B
MTSLILTTATRYLLPLLLLFSFFMLVRGHNEPGGGFMGGLVAAAAFALYAIAFNVSEARRLMKVDPHLLFAVGLLLAVGSGGVAPLFFRQPFLTGIWSDFGLPAIGKLGTPLLFDLGVYFVVVGITMLIIFSLAEE